VWRSAIATAIALLGFAAVHHELGSRRDYPGLPPEVRDTFLMAKHLLQEGDLARRTAAVPLLESVVSRVPAFAEGHGNLAAALFWAGRWDHARTAARKALSLDSGESTALLIEGSLALMIEWNWSQAESLLQRAVDRSPGDPVVLAGRAFVLITSGRSEEGIADLRRAQSVEPVVAWLAGDLGLMYLYAGDLPAAATACERAITLEPGVLHPLSCALTARLSLGDTTMALRHARRLAEMLGGDQRTVPDDGVPDRRGALNQFLTWRVAHARQVLAKEPLAAFSAALVLAEAGQDAAALDALSLAASQRSPGLVTATVDPRLASLHATSAFHRIVAPLTAAGAGLPGRPLARKAQMAEGLPN
jgi:Flp pilus assembly protein TadD